MSVRIAFINCSFQIRAMLCSGSACALTTLHVPASTTRSKAPTHQSRFLLAMVSTPPVRMARALERLE
jgi:hypothetical protein